MVSLKKKGMAVREFTPVHLIGESMTVAQRTVEVKKEPNVPAVKVENTAKINMNDLTSLSQSELCELTRSTVDKMSADYEMIERITTEAQRRASIEDHGNENYWGDVDYFQDRLAEKIIFGYKRYKKCNRRKAVFINTTGEKTSQILVDTKEYPNDLTALSRSELCALMRKVTEGMSARYELVKRFIAEVQRRANIEDNNCDDCFEYIDFFQYVLVEKIIYGHKQYKKRHRFEDGFDFTVGLIKRLIIVGLFGGSLYAIFILLSCFFSLFA